MSLARADLVMPDWPAPARVRAFTTTRRGGVSGGSYAELNLGGATQDDPEHVAENRRRFEALLPAAPGWLQQVHGRSVIQRDLLGERPTPADGCWTGTTDLPCTVLTADCLPVLFCDLDARVVAAAHAGWRGLRAGVLAQTVDALGVPPHRLMAWIGPGIGPRAYEVGPAFEREFRAAWPWLKGGFLRVRGQVHADLPALARVALERAGVASIHGGGFCTYTDSERFFSHRRDPACGRMATTIWLEGD